MGIHAQSLEESGAGGSLGSHVHGIAELNLAMDQDVLEIEFHSPAANIYGFEHQPRTEAEHETVDIAQDRLRQADALFTFTADAGCRLVESELLELDDVEHPEHDHAEHGTEHDDHAASGKHDDHDDAVHSEVRAHYRYECGSPERLDRIVVHLFNSFPALEKINLQLITPRMQSGQSLTANNNRVDLSGH